MVHEPFKGKKLPRVCCRFACLHVGLCVFVCRCCRCLATANSTSRASGHSTRSLRRPALSRWRNRPNNVHTPARARTHKQTRRQRGRGHNCTRSGPQYESDTTASAITETPRTLRVPAGATTLTRRVVACPRGETKCTMGMAHGLEEEMRLKALPQRGTGATARAWTT